MIVCCNGSYFLVVIFKIILMLRNFLFLFLFVSISSCTKDGINLDVSGTWELVSAQAMAGSITYQPGNGYQLTLQSSGSFERREPGRAPETGHYILSKKPDCVQIPGREGRIIITFHSTTSAYQCYVEIIDDKLHVNSEVCVSDGLLAIYRRI